MTQRLTPRGRKPRAVLNWVSQVWPFAHEMQKGDLVVLAPEDAACGLHRRDYGDYHAETTGPNPFFHWRAVKWIGEAIPARTLARTCCFLRGVSHHLPYPA